MCYGLKFGSTTQDPLQVRTTGGPSGLPPEFESFAGISMVAHAHSSESWANGIVSEPQALTFHNEAPGGDLESDFIASELLLAVRNTSIWRPNSTPGRHQAPHVEMSVARAL